MPRMRSARPLAVLMTFTLAATVRAEERSTPEVTRSLTWTEVVPAPIAAEGIPLIGTVGVDESGFPRQDIDRAALHGLLVRREFRRLTTVVEAIQARFEADPRFESWMVSVGDALGTPHPKELELIEAWIVASPRSFAPYLARGIYWQQTASLWRGTRAAADTSDREFQAMTKAVERARADLERADSLRPGLALALDELIGVHLLRGSRRDARRAMEDALARCPSCYYARFLWLQSIRPRWGGSLEAMESFVRERSDPADPHRPLLEAFVDWDRGDEARMMGKADDARMLHQRACVRAQREPAFAVVCAGEQHDASDGAGALLDLNRAADTHPGHHDVRLARATKLAAMKRWEEAGRDLLFVLRTDPTAAPRLYERVVNALAALAWKAAQFGRTDDAERLYALALELAPTNKALALTASQARKASPDKTAPSPIDLDDERASITLTVRDETGRPVSGATAFTLPRDDSAWTLFRSLDLPRDATVTDTGGLVRLPVQPGPRLVMARLPGDATRGVVVGLEVPPQGVTMSIAPAGQGTISGRVLDPGSRPLAGVEVWALPVVGRMDARARSFGSAKSSADGSFVISGIDQGPYLVFTHSEVYTGPRSGVAATGSGPEIVIPVQRYQVLRGRILVSSTKGLTPAPEMELNGLGHGPTRVATTDGAFSFSFAERSPNSAVSFSVPGRPPVYRTLDVRGDAIDVGEIVIGTGRKLRGRVVDSAGNPLWQAAIRTVGGQELGKTVLDGTFELDLQDGPVELNFWRQGYLLATRQIGASDTELSVTLSRGAQLKVLVLDDEEKPVVDLSLIALGAASCKTDPGGRCELRGLPAGQAVVEPLPHGRRKADLPLPPALYVPDLGADEERSLVIRWPLSPSRLTVQILASGGPSKPSAVRVYPASPRVIEAISSSRTTTEPYYLTGTDQLLENLPAGRYVVVHRSGGACAMAAVDLRGGAERSVTLEPRDGGCAGLAPH
jgi:tetratricopeptide (TPR) repeat protein